MSITIMKNTVSYLPNLSQGMGWMRWAMAGLLLCLGYSNPSTAALTPGSCYISTPVGSGYEIQPTPAQMTNGFVIAKQKVSMVLSYTKTGTNLDINYFAGWYGGGTMGAYSTKAVSASSGKVIPGLGFRVSYPPTGVIAKTTPYSPFAQLYATTSGAATLTQELLLEFVVTDANLYKGGSPAFISDGQLFNIIFANKDGWDAQNVTAGGTRCVGINVLLPSQVINLGGITVPELPPPTLPTCSLGATAITVPLDPLDASQLPAVGSSAGATSFTIPLGSCGKDAKPYITLTDSANISNRTSDLTLASSSSAKGVAIRLSKGDGSAMQLGAQNTTVNSTNVGQFLVGTSPADNTPMSVQLSASYVRTGNNIEPGSVKADGIFTIAYP
ncbi:TPA: fimbrial protein [Serratia fonticola]